MVHLMRAAYMTGLRQIEIRRVPRPEPGPGEVLVRVRAVGVCGSDVHYYLHGRIGPFVVNAPLILGHECSGEIVAVGAGVSPKRIGERVALEPGIPCRKCRHCKTGRYNLCPDVRFLATPPVDGAFVEYLVFPEDFVFPLPATISLDEGALIEPLATGVYACRRAEVQPGAVVAVLGAGPIGLLTMQAARAFGAARVAVIDKFPYRVDLAKRLGADVAVLYESSESFRALSKELGAPPDVVFETAGSVATAQAAVHLAERGGKVVVIGLVPDDMVPLPVTTASTREVDIIGIFRYANVFPTAIEMVASRRVDVRSLISGSFSLDETQRALEAAEERKSTAIKFLVRP